MLLHITCMNVKKYPLYYNIQFFLATAMPSYVPDNTVSTPITMDCCVGSSNGIGGNDDRLSKVNVNVI